MSDSIDTSVALSVVIPAFNEAGNIAPLIERLLPILDTIGLPFEVIFVDDGSRDATWMAISTAAAEHATVAGLKLSRNFGHQHALLAGLTASRGNAVVSMDADLQHPPEVISELVDRWKAGDKIVYTKRIMEERSGHFKRLSSRYFYRIFSWLSDVTIDEGSSDFRLIDRQVIVELLRFQDVNLFLRGAVQWLGFDSKASVVQFDVESRHTGESKYDLGRMLRFASSAIVSFSTKPLVLGIWIGIATSLLALCELIYVVYMSAVGETIPGWASTIGVVTFLFGILFVILGINGAYLASIHQSLHGRPKFVIESMTEKPNHAQGLK